MAKRWHALHRRKQRASRRHEPPDTTWAEYCADYDDSYDDDDDDDDYWDYDDDDDDYWDYDDDDSYDDEPDTWGY